MPKLPYFMVAIF